MLRSELGAEVGELFASFDREPLAAASIAQVHAATLPSGARVVVKVRRPDVSQIVDRALDIAGRLAARLERSTSWGRAVGTAGLAAGFAAALREEFDLRVKARNMISVAAAPGSRGSGGIAIPVPYQPLCTGLVLVMEPSTGVRWPRSTPACPLTRAPRWPAACSTACSARSCWRGLSTPTALVADRVPDRVCASMQQRLERTSEGARQVAIVAASLGRRFSLDAVAAMLNVAPASLLQPVDYLLHNSILIERGNSLAFFHDLTYEGVRSSIPASIRRSLDRQVATVLPDRTTPSADT